LLWHSQKSWTLYTPISTITWIRYHSRCLQVFVIQLSCSRRAVIRYSSGSCPAVIRQLSGSLRAVVGQSSDSHLVVFRQMSTVVRQSSCSCRTVVRQLSASRRPVVRQSSGNCSVYETRFSLIWATVNKAINRPPASSDAKSKLAYIAVYAVVHSCSLLRIAPQVSWAYQLGINEDQKASKVLISVHQRQAILKNLKSISSYR
jgi:hypothetical protein